MGAIASRLEALARGCECLVSCDDYSRESVLGCFMNMNDSGKWVGCSLERDEVLKLVSFGLSD